MKIVIFISLILTSCAEIVITERCVKVNGQTTCYKYEHERDRQ